MSDSVHDSIYEAIASIRLIDPHTHINPHAPASGTLADLLGYHYYTELAHSAGMPKDQIEADGLPPRELVHRLVSNLSPIENTAQYRWLVEICRMFFGFEGDRIDLSNWEEVYDSAERQMRLAEWPQMVLDQSNVEAVFLTNDFDDGLSGFDTDTYIPCLRTDDLVFHLARRETRQRLETCSGIELDGSLRSLRESLNQRFQHFVANGARACAISLPPSFEPARVSDGRAATALDEVLRSGPQADPSHQAALSRRVFWTLAELCDEYSLPFDLMIGVNRGVYADGVFQGQDLYDSRVSLIQYRELFNSFPAVKFPISVLASVTNQELVSYAWIFPNVITNGHWWYSNTPSFIARDAAARLEAVPQTKQIAYYSDAYKLEFVWPKFDMYRRVLSGILADHFVKECRWSEERAIELGRQVLRDNVDEIFPRPLQPAETWEDVGKIPSDPTETTDHSLSGLADPALAGTSAALTAGAIGMVEVNDPAEAPVEHAEGEVSAEHTDESDLAAVSGADQDFETLVLEDSTTGHVAEQASFEDDAHFVDDSDVAATINDTVRIETVIEEPTDETVRIDELESAEQSEPINSETIQDAARYFDEPQLEIDPLPSAEEITAVEVDDVELRDFSAEKSAPDADAIQAEADAEPLDVGDLLGEGEATQSSNEEIRLLRGEESFEPDEDSLKLQPHPLTGELTFPLESNDEAPNAGEESHDSAEAAGNIDETVSDDELFLDAAEDAFDDGDDSNVLDDPGGTIELEIDAFEPEKLLDDSIAESSSESPDEQVDSE